MFIFDHLTDWHCPVTRDCRRQELRYGDSVANVSTVSVRTAGINYINLFPCSHALIVMRLSKFCIQMIRVIGTNDVTERVRI